MIFIYYAKSAIFILCKIAVSNQTYYISVKMGQNIVRIIYFHIIILNLLISYVISFFIFPNCDMRTHVLPSRSFLISEVSGSWLGVG